MRFFPIAGNRSRRTVARTFCAAFAFLGIDRVYSHSLADMSSAFLFHDMFHILIPEILDGAEHRKRRALAQSAERTVFDKMRQIGMDRICRRILSE